MRFLGRRAGVGVVLVGGVLALCACQGTPPPLTVVSTQKSPNHEPLAPEVLRAMWKVQGDQIKDGAGSPVTLRGVAFGNQVWEDEPLPSAHHTQVDYERVAQMGMNSVRFYLSYRTFEDDASPYQYKQDGFDWIDQNVEWAKAHGIRLVLNMHSPAGGYQSQGKGRALWEDETSQNRFVELWRAIAERYRAEPTIAGYDLLNEPVPTKSQAQWEQLAQTTIEQIREVDQHHMVFVERVNAIAGDWSENENRNFFRVSDPNVVYEFHFYKPFHFTHQSAEWSDFAAREGWYPDANVPEVEWFHLKTEAMTQSEAMPAGDSDWTLLETEPFVVNDPRLVVGKPFLVCDGGGGSAFFDSLSLVKVVAKATEPGADAAAAGANDRKSPSIKSKPAVTQEVEPEAETIFEMDLDTRRGWYFWNPGEVGSAQFVPEGHGDNSSLGISGTTGPANLGSDPLRFSLQQGAQYQLAGLARGRGLHQSSSCRLRLEFSSSRVPVLARDKEFLRQELQAYLSWGKREGVPLYLGEFGTIRDSFLPGRGGPIWVQDMVDLLVQYQVHFAYHAYHEGPFGIFNGGSSLPTDSALNRPLFEVFVKTLVGKDATTVLLPNKPGQAPAPAQVAKPEVAPPAASEVPAADKNFHEFD